MPSDTIESPVTTARFAGALWLIVIIASLIDVLAVPAINTTGTPAQTAASVLASEGPIRLGFALNVLVSVCYLGVTALLYDLLRPVGRGLALFGAFAGVGGIIVGAASAVDELAALGLLRDAATATPDTANQLQTIAQLAFRAGPEFAVSMVFFGFQIVSVGYLIFRSTFLPRIIGAVLVLGGASYIAISLAKFVAPTLGMRMGPLVIPIAIIGEGALTLWLLFKGVDAERWRLHPRRTAPDLGVAR
ncbi:MAG TPA: DUF4386 domain-containing protein [Gemmatimonadaceae bacterium]|nr:DUF4386 domain-containing protein [Gemmatimonadaceae bacterium]